uniref:Dynein attachment factor N-terminal domain-containing protein n=1 Tax=Chromera velia CCMP2878 TaxID=1169474 RepID=A0A0G4HAR6_9ALVE|eukprot:Cvel_25802.t1-p1 / transcript=Cvel_25802.t1 / gene=Cvel_25802 / organism=Chromera_velia_CCMP2878 / gene_product=Coiled-coil domain-containing protein 103 homolog, putative / transcript_product=Coiled-coil domain-containing protein 103 homolog, putative / location=Cvel_scaffold2973:12279-14409(+) / protein_length=279 / sequence_SO=supercontig / SO=protein_coding / is_pseudo=false
MDGMRAELATAIEKERKHKVVDEQKKRAIYSAPSYDAFKDLVATADLKPVNRQDLDTLFNDKPKRQIFNSHFIPKPCCNSLAEKGAAASAQSQATIHTEGSHPKTPAELDREWRCCRTAEQKIRFMSGLRCGPLASIFLKETDPDLVLCAGQTFEEELKGLEEKGSKEGEEGKDTTEGGEWKSLVLSAARTFFSAVANASPTASDGLVMFLSSDEKELLRRVIAQVSSGNPHKAFAHGPDGPQMDSEEDPNALQSLSGEGQGDGERDDDNLQTLSKALS